jgi:poly(beta-D-mannuronate) lyase
MKKYFSLTSLIIFSVWLSYAISYKARNFDEYKLLIKKLTPGDSLILANGVWKNAEFSFKANGEADKYIYLVAETPGQVSLEGKSRLQLSGKYLYVSGLKFSNGSTPKNAVIEFRTSATEYAYHSIISNCLIDRYNQPTKDSADHWVSLYGKKNTVEYCYFGGKNNQGTTLVVWPNDSNSTNNGHLIYRNYFGPRPRLGANGGETMRIGTSQVCHLNSGTIVDGNYFEHCNGEVEIISNKSGDNKFVNNTFFECEGSLVLRHGNNALVSGNWFIGNGKINTGGVRIINEGHKIFNNYFYRLAGDEFRSGIAVMNAIPNSPANGYAPVRNVIIANNTFYDCAYPWAFGVGFGERNRIVRPENTLLLNNLLYCPNTKELIRDYDPSDGIKYDNNVMINNSGNLKTAGSVEAQVLNGKVFGIDMVYTQQKARKLPFVKYDILGQVRSDAVIGAFQNTDVTPALEIATANNCGPEWYHPKSTIELQKVKPTGKTILVEPGADNLTKAVKKASSGDILLLQEGDYSIGNKIVINKNLTIKSDSKGKKPIIKLKSERNNNSFFEMNGSARLQLDGVELNGDSKAAFPAKYAFMTSKEGAFGYSLFVNNCEIYDINTDGGAIFKAYKGSMADSIKISGSVMRDSYRGISLSDEKDDTGKYNAENVVLENSVFSNITQYAVDFYRGGNDESTLGGSLSIDHCVFDFTGDNEKQDILKLTGIVSVKITNSIFSNSTAKMSVKLSGLKNIMSNCNFYNCARPKCEKGATATALFFENPAFEKKSYLLSKKSKLHGQATDGGNIGLR